MGLIWKRDPLSTLLEGASTHAYMDLGEEFELHQYLTRLDKLRSSAKSEVDIKGSFPDTSYGRILQNTGAMLDAFHAMNVMILKNPKASPGEAEILRYTAIERAALCARISHLFQGKRMLHIQVRRWGDRVSVLASSMKLEFPMNGALPSVSHTRDRLLAKIFRFRRQEQNRAGATDEDFELLYSYGQSRENLIQNHPTC